MKFQIWWFFNLLFYFIKNLIKISESDNKNLWARVITFSEKVPELRSWANLGAMQFFIEDFISETNSIKDREELFEIYRRAIAQFGFSSAVYTFITDHSYADQKAGHGVQCNFPEDWMAHYIENNYLEIDPAIMWGHHTHKEFAWEDIARSEYLSFDQKLILNQAKEAGLRNGIGVPLHGPHGEFAGVGLASDVNGANLSKDALSKLRLITEQFHVCYCDLSSKEERHEIPVLTPREREMLKWWAVGKTTEEIAIILNCSPSNVRWHIKSVYQKLDANTKVLAVTKAIRMGIITLDLIKIA